MDYNQRALTQHKHYQGKIEINNKIDLNTREDLSIYYSPGVAAPCKLIQQDPDLARDYTRKGNTIAVVSDGSAVLGLGNIGGLAGLPVMEGKAALFKKFWGVNAIPIVLDTQDPEQIIKTVQAIAPSFWGINLEDITAPQCFYIEKQLQQTLNIPVFHDDQHGTAIVVLAGIINALKLSHKTIEQVKIVISWAGAAGIAIAKLLKSYGAQHLILVDSQGIISTHRDGLNAYKAEFIPTNRANISGDLAQALVDADIFIWVSRPNLITSKEVASMNPDPIIFALSNPDPEITPEEAKRWGAKIIATGRSDLPNQINNVLVFPGIFKGALAAKIPQIQEHHKIAAAKALANAAGEIHYERIIPSVFDEGIADIIAQSIIKSQYYQR